MRLTSLCLAISAALFAAPAMAHHSFAMFDQTKTVDLQGVVMEFQWTNPHSWLVVVVTDQKGETAEWALEMAATGALTRQGLRPGTIKPGDKVRFKAHPLRTGEPGGQYLSVVLPDGKEMKDD